MLHFQKKVKKHLQQHSSAPLVPTYDVPATTGRSPKANACNPSPPRSSIEMLISRRGWRCHIPTSLGWLAKAILTMTTPKSCETVPHTELYLVGKREECRERARTRSSHLVGQTYLSLVERWISTYHFVISIPLKLLLMTTTQSNLKITMLRRYGKMNQVWKKGHRRRRHLDGSSGSNSNSTNHKCRNGRNTSCMPSPKWLFHTLTRVRKGGGYSSF